MIEQGAVAGEGRLDLAGEVTVLLRRREALLALGGIFVGLPPRNMKQMPDQFGGLAHIELGDRIGEPALEPDHRREERRTQREERGQFRADAAGGKQPAIPGDRAIGEHQRRVAQRFRAAGQHQIGHAFADVAIRGVDRLHAGAAIDLHGERRHRFAHAEAERGDARRVHLVGDDVDAAEDHLVEGVRRERLAQQQRPAALHGEIDRRERPRLAARLDERRAAAVDDVDRAAPYSAACDAVPGGGRVGISSGGGNSTASEVVGGVG